MIQRENLREALYAINRALPFPQTREEAEDTELFDILIAARDAIWNELEGNR